MKKSKAETAETRRRIVETAAREIHRKGIDATGVAEVMFAAGLTRGGFYRHFASKEHLVAEACTAGLDAIVDRAEIAAAGSADDGGLEGIFENYLSVDHRDDTSSGCPLAGIGSELARADEQTRAAARGGLERLLELIAKQTLHRSSGAARSDALFALSAMVGALTLSRIASGHDLSTAILDETKRHLARSTGRRSASGARGRRTGSQTIGAADGDADGKTTANAVRGRPRARS